jgi:hypothetical protein
VLARIVHVVVHAEHQRDIFVRGRSGDDDLLHRALDVRNGLRAVGEPAGGLDDHFGADAAPVDLGGILDGEDLQHIILNVDRVAVGLDVLLQGAEDRVVLQQVRERLRVGQVIGGHELDLRIRQGRAEHIPPDTAEAVDANFSLCVSFRYSYR